MHPLLDLEGKTLAEKADRIERFYPPLHNHPSGIFYSMMKIDGETIRPFGREDFIGVRAFDFSGWRIRPEGPWEYRNNENSITTSGLWLAALSARLTASPTAEARTEAARAFASLRAIYTLGVRDGRPGWLGKPYGFRLSDQTSPDQYLDALFGLWSYREHTSETTRREVDRIIVAAADYWRSVDYTIFYLDRTWRCGEEEHAYNAIFVAINAAAFAVSRERRFREEAQRFLERGKWSEETKVDAFMRSVRGGEEIEWEPNRLVGKMRRPGEFLCWETTIHAKFAAVSAWIAHEAIPDLVSEAMLEDTIAIWWKTWDLGIDEELLPYYFFLIDSATGEWRPAPLTQRLPRDQWFLGQPGLSHTSGKRWTEPLARFMITSVLAARHAPAIGPDAADLAKRVLDAVDATRMRWQIDPDGEQIAIDQRDVVDVLSSEMPASCLLTYWMGKRDGLWQ